MLAGVSVERYTLKPVIDREYKLAEVNEAFRMLEEREVFGKVVVKP